MWQPDVGLVTVNERDSGVKVVHGFFPRRRFCSKRLLFGAVVSEAARQLSSFSGWLIDQVT